MAYTISFHNQGGKAHREHNVRNPKCVNKEQHIDKDGVHEIWADEKPQDAYKRLFEEAAQRYREKQIQGGHGSRIQENYYKSIRESSKKHAVYEVVVSIGSYKKHPDKEITKQILKEFYETWSERNPNFELIGCYYHEDEGKGSNTPYGHIHLDYVPVARNLTRGMDTQNSLEKSLNQMGYFSESKRNTAQMKWEKSENIYLEKICREHGLEIEHPELEHKNHMDMKEFRQMKRIEELETKNSEMEKIINMMIDRHNELIDLTEELETGTVELATEILERHEEERNEIYHELSR